MDPKLLKMYILVPPWCPDNFAPCATAHGSLMAHLKWDTPWENQNVFASFPYNDWLKYSFKKVIVRVDQDQWNYFYTQYVSKDYPDRVVIVTENTMNNLPVCMVMHPSDCVDPKLKKLKLWSPKK